VKDVRSKKEFDEMVKSCSPFILHFWASWCEASKQMDQVFAHLSADFPHVHFFRVEAEEQQEISQCYSLSSVPYFVFCKDGKTVDTLEGADPSSLANKIAKLVDSVESGSSASHASIGMAAGPAVIEAIKEISKEPSSYPGENQTSDLSASLKTRLQQLVDSHPVFLFMKGSPEEPRCGFSKKVVNILKSEGVEFGSFDILSDNEVREGMKKFSNWPTFPQLFSQGELIGGCDIIIAMHEEGELKELIGPKETLEERLKKLISSSPTMLFMKGSPDAPRCGFSSKVVNALREVEVGFGSFDILSDEDVRQGIKTFSNWPTFPQLYHKGELVGGCDIILELHANGELKDTLS